MGSKKKKTNHRNSQHVFRKRKPHQLKRSHKVQSSKQHANAEVGETTQNKCDCVALGGSRIIDLQQYTTELTQHASSCEGSIILSGEIRQELASIFSGKCSKCAHTITLETIPKRKVLGSKQDGTVIWQHSGDRL